MPKISKKLPDAKYRGVSCRKFFEKRFKRKPESDPIYYLEWRDRFRRYRGLPPTSYMDSESKATFKKLLKKK